jgi:hypothetical protein
MLHLLRLPVSCYDPYNHCTEEVGLGQYNPRPPLLKAPIRAGGTVQFNWTEIVRMHFGPALAVGPISPKFK